MIALAPLIGLAGIVLWLTAEIRMPSDATVARGYVSAGLVVALTGAALLIRARLGSDV
jgi:hypothetical protein